MKCLQRTALLALCLVALLAAGASAQQPPAGPPPSVASEPPPEPGADELNAAARKGDVAAVRALLDKGISPDAKWRYGMTALFPAAERGHLEVVKLLLERGANVNTQDRFYNATPMTWALDKGHVEIVRLLLDRGARNSENVLMTGIRKDSAELVRVSLEKGGLSPENLTAALHRATKDNKPALAELLRGGGAKPPLALDEATLAKFAGTYSREGGAPFTFAVKDGALVGGPPGQNLIMIALEPNLFRPENFEGVKITFLAEGDKVTGAKLKQGNNEMSFTKAESKP